MLEHVSRRWPSAHSLPSTPSLWHSRDNKLKNQYKYSNMTLRDMEWLHYTLKNTEARSHWPRETSPRVGCRSCHINGLVSGASSTYAQGHTGLFTVPDHVTRIDVFLCAVRVKVLAHLLKGESLARREDVRATHNTGSGEMKRRCVGTEFDGISLYEMLLRGLCT